MDDRALLSLSLRLNEAAFDGAPLDDALAGLARAFKADEVMLYRDDAAGALAEVQSLRMTPEMLAEYRRAALPQNPRRALWLDARYGVALDFDTLVPSEALERGGLADVMRRTGFPSRHVAGVRIAVGDGIEARFSIGRNRGGLFGRTACAAIEALAPHLAAALRARMVLGAEGEAAAHPWLADIEALPHPLAIASGAPQFLHANAALRALARRRDGLVVGHARLSAVDPGSDAMLAAAQVDLLQARGSGRPIRGFVVPRSGKAAPYFVQAIALGTAAPHGHAVLLVVTDPEAGRPDAATLRSFLGLTEAEAALAAELATGAPLAVAARARGIGLETARTQLKSVLAKTGCARQPDLARLLARLGTAKPSP